MCFMRKFSLPKSHDGHAGLNARRGAPATSTAAQSSLTHTRTPDIRIVRRTVGRVVKVVKPLSHWLI